MMKAGVPLLQSFDIVGRGHSNPAVARLLMSIKTDVETGSSLTQAFRKYPLHFDALFCNLVGAGEQAGILESLLDRLASYKEKTQAIKSKIKAALFYPIAIIGVAFIITAVIMIFVIPAFKQVFTSFGADLPTPTLVVMAISDNFVRFWYIIFPAIFGGVYGFMYSWKRSLAVQIFMDKLLLKAPVFGHLIRISTIARWTRTLSTMFAAGVPLVEALDSVGGAAGNYVYLVATKQIQQAVSTGSSLTVAMTDVGVFPSMVIQMVQIGEESGALDGMLSKVADFFEAEVDDAVDALSSLITAVIMIFVIPAFKQVFTSFGADLPTPTLVVMAISDNFVRFWYIIFPAIFGGVYGFMYSWKRSLAVQIFMDKLLLKAPVFGHLIRISTIARWTRTLSTMFAAGVPLVEALDSVGGAAGNYVYLVATKQIQQAVSTGSSLTVAMTDVGVFPSMVIQMVQIGEESGALDGMLSKVADFFEAEVDDAVDALSSLMEPVIMVVLGTLIGGMVIAMYLPIFKLGQAV
ncbi:MAG: hypothetical protein A3G80_05855 [Betaproteobacteria bacterium RIFCSPLOWO2_12_FULL_62_13b]|nr:MAG: hypothetical protein A3G80_05855 [Betaproteobacteria bacterium RIFCSPLOWO2_12_FULL_62_13b]